MIIDDNIKDEKLQYDLNRETAEYELYHHVKLTNTNILQVKKYKFFFRKSFGKITKND